MKKFIILFLFALFFIGCESDSTYSGLCKDKEGNRIIFSHFKTFHYLNSTVFHNKSYSMEISIEEMDECYFYKDGGKYDKNNENKESNK